MTVYAPHTSTDAVARAQGWVGDAYPMGWCQRWVVAEIFGTGGVGDWDHDGAADAEDGWRQANAKVSAAQITSLDRVPAGVACYWTGGAHDYGHAAVSAGNGYIYSTDLPYTGKVGKVPITTPHTKWGLTFAGYATVMNGFTITDRPVTTPSPGTVTTFDICEWNIARPRWYTPWAGRAAEIARELKDEASVYCFQELFENEQIATVKAALPKCQQFTGPAGLEFFFDASPDRWLKTYSKNHYSGIANRWAQEVTLRRIQTGQLVTFFNVHAPINAEGSTAKAQYGQWLAGKVKAVTNPVVVAGDFNTSTDANSPKKELRALGYIGFKEQVAVVNEGTKEFIPKGQDLADIRTHPSGTNDADVASGLVDLSTNTVESDHRRIEAQVRVTA